MSYTNIHFPTTNRRKIGNKGKRVGVAYQLENGEIIYVPE